MTCILRLWPVLLLPVLVLLSCDPDDSVPVNNTICNCNGQPFFSPDTGSRLFLPTAFTPNGDGRNDIYHPVNATNVSASGFELKVFNTQSQVVFQAINSLTTGWDGTDGNGQPLPSGLYQVRLKYDTPNIYVDTCTCIALLRPNANGCLPTGGQTDYTFEDQYDPAVNDVIYQTGEVFCP